MSNQILFEAELRRCGLAFQFEPEKNELVVDIAGEPFYIQLDALGPQSESDVAAIVNAIRQTNEDYSPLSDFFWCLQPHENQKPSPYRVSISKTLDRVLCRVSDDGAALQEITKAKLTELLITDKQAIEAGFRNLTEEANELSVDTDVMDGITIATLESDFAFRASLILAPNLKAVTQTVLSWPLVAVIPDPDFIYLCSAKNTRAFLNRVSYEVHDIYSQAEDPLSLEALEISDQGIKSIGAVPKK